MTSRFTVSPAAQRDYRILGGAKPSGAEAVARNALKQAKASSGSSSVHVTARDNGWAVKSAGSVRASSIEHAKGGKIIKNTKPAPEHK